MEKLIYLLWGDAPEGSDALRDRLVGGLAPELIELGAERVSVNVDDSGSNCPSPVPTPHGEAPHIAQVSFWLDCYDQRAPLEECIDLVGLRFAGYLVTESLYTDYGDNEWSTERSWPAGARSPAVLTVCLIHRPSGMAYREWIDAWHGVQSPVSARIQPRMRYVRNEVVRGLTDGAPEIDGIVEEAWPSADHITDPMLFFNAFDDRDVLNANIELMLERVGRFIDMDRMRNVTMSEYLFY